MKIAHIGNLANLGALTCFFLRRLGVDAHLYVNSNQGFRPLPYADKDEIYDWVHVFPRKNNLHYAMTHAALSFELAQYDLVHSWTASLLPPAELLLRLAGKKYFASATGSDLREEARKNTLNGYRVRRHFQNAAWVAHTFDPMTIEVADRLGLKNCDLFKIPIAPLESPGAVRFTDRPGPIFFCPSRLHIKRNTSTELVSKNNDRFIRAFARFIKGGGQATLLLVKHGDNLAEVEQLIDSLGLAGHIQWLDFLTPQQLVDVFHRCDVVVDQFSDFSYPAPGGGIAFEAMACAKPLLTYFDTAETMKFYGSVPPHLVCKTEDEILEQIISCQDLNMLKEHGQAAQEWALEHHGWEKLTNHLIMLYQQNI